MAKLENTIITPWQSDNNYAITKSGVEKQDEFTLEDYLDNPSAGSANLKDTGLQFLSQTYAGKIQNYVNGLTGNSSDNGSLRPKSTVNSSGDSIGLDFKKIKEEKYKNIKLTSKLGQYNSAMNLLGIASGMYVGTLGQGGIQVLDDAIGMASQSLPIAGLTTNAATTVSKVIQTAKSNSNAIPTIVPTDNIVDLAVANYYTILTSKPGLKIKSYGNKLEYITDENSNSALMTKEELEEYKNKFKFFNEDSDGYFTTGTILTNEGVLNIKDINNSLDTIINSSVRREVRVTKETEVLTDYELPENTKELNDFFKKNYEEYFETGAKNFPRVTKARIFNRVNNIYRNIGGLYIEPFMNSIPKTLKCFEIPFEFNPTITEGTQTAKYNTTEVLGRIQSLRSYISSDASTVSIEADYLALAEEFEEGGEVILEERRHMNKKDSWISGWMSDWTTKRLSIIERQFRSLTLPYVNKSEFVRPPIVRIKMRSTSLKGDRGDGQIDEDVNSLKIGDLFRYPSLGEKGSGVTQEKIQITHHYENVTRDKRYIVTGVTITPLSQYGNSYFYNINGIHSLSSNSAFYNSVKRNGFKVRIELAETTKNFLDLLPNYGDYVGNGESDDLVYFNENADYLTAIKDNIDLWSCLNSPLKMDLTHIYSNGYLFPFVEDAGFIKTNKISEDGEKTEKTEEIENEILNPEKNTGKEFKDYKEELYNEGLSYSEIAILLYESTSWKNNNAFQKWLLKDCYTDFNRSWDEYYALLKKLEFTDTEVYTKVEGNWRKEPKYIDEFLPKINISFNDYINILIEAYPDSKSTIILKLKNSRFNAVPQDEDDIDERNEFQNFMVTRPNLVFSSFYDLVENSGLVDDEIIYLCSGSGKQKEQIGYKEYYTWEQTKEFYRWLFYVGTEDFATSGEQRYFKYLSRNNSFKQTIEEAHNSCSTSIEFVNLVANIITEITNFTNEDVKLISKYINLFATDEYKDLVVFNASSKEFTVNNKLNIYMYAVTGLENYVKEKHGENAIELKYYIVYLMEKWGNNWESIKEYKEFVKDINVYDITANDAYNFGIDSYKKMEEYKYIEEKIEENFDENDKLLIGEFYNDSNYSPDDSDSQGLIDDNFLSKDYNMQMFLVFFKNSNEENKFILTEMGKNENENIIKYVVEDETNNKTKSVEENKENNNG